MGSSVPALLVVAGLGATAFVVSKLVRRFVPEIVVFLALGVLVGPQGLRILSERNVESLELVTTVAVGAIMFLLGDRLRVDDLRAHRGVLVPLNLVQILATGGLVYLATRLAGASVQVAALLALVAAETGVLTVTATVKEERAKGPFTDQLLTSVGLTNVAVASLFGVAFPFVLAASGEASGPLASARGDRPRVSGSASISCSVQPAAGTRRASRPRAVPTNSTARSGSARRSASATASAGTTWPPVPPPATRTVRRPSSRAALTTPSPPAAGRRARSTGARRGRPW